MEVEGICSINFRGEGDLRSIIDLDWFEFLDFAPDLYSGDFDFDVFLNKTS